MTAALDELLAGLDPAQADAVATDAYPLAIIAAAGAGKTSVLTRRIARRVRAEQVEERHVVALTFSRQAASELHRRLGRLGVRGVTAGTFHAVAYGVLRQRWTDQGRPAPGLLVNRNQLLAEAAGAASGRRRMEPLELGSELDWARAGRRSLEEYGSTARQAGRRTQSSASALAEAMDRYRTLKHRRRVVDFDDLLESVLAEMSADPGFAAQVHWRFRHFFVDEFQDVNPLQHAVLEAWRAGRPDLCVVGDPRQAIYGWNGADPRLLDDVATTFPGIRIIRLRNNYRCTPAVVDAAAAVLATGESTDDSVAVRADPGRLVVLDATDPEHEARIVVEELRRAHLPGGRWASMAVLARTNHQLPAIRDALDRAGIPSELAGRPNAPIVDDPARRALLSDARSCIGPIELTAWGRDLDDGVAEEAASPLHRRLARAVRTYLAGVPDGGGASFVEWYELTGGDDDAVVERRDGVTLSTFHAAKGREWRTVVVTGCEVGLVPHAASTAPDAAAEEIRLLYVALTRASDHLAVTWCAERNGRVTGPSPLIERLTERSDPTPVPVLAARRVVAAVTSDPALEALLRWRERAAAAAALPAVAICDDEALRAVAAARPATIEELAEVPGISRLAAARLGPRLLAVLGEH